MNKNFCVDLDDTILNFRVPMMPALNLHTGKAIHWKDWNGGRLEDIYDITSKEFIDILIDADVINRALPIPGAREALLKLKEAGYDIHIITARGWHPDGLALTKKWFADHNMVYDTINIVALHSSKADIMDKFENVKCLIDDNEHNCMEVISRGYDAFLITMPWNVNSALNRLNSIEEIVSLL